MARIHCALAFAALAALPALGAIPEPDGLAPSLRASANEEAAFMLSASGIHRFECKPLASDLNAFAWNFVAPDATLSDAAGPVATQQATGRFDSDRDRTSVSTIVRATQPGGAQNLPWAAMRAAPIGEGGLFADVTSVQRVNTSGGVAPAQGCGAQTAGSEASVDFSADYYFYKRRGTT